MKKSGHKMSNPLENGHKVHNPWGDLSALRAKKHSKRSRKGCR